MRSSTATSPRTRTKRASSRASRDDGQHSSLKYISHRGKALSGSGFLEKNTDLRILLAHCRERHFEDLTDENDRGGLDGVLIQVIDLSPAVVAICRAACWRSSTGCRRRRRCRYRCSRAGRASQAAWAGWARRRCRCSQAWCAGRCPCSGRAGRFMVDLS